MAKTRRTLGLGLISALSVTLAMAGCRDETGPTQAMQGRFAVAPIFTSSAAGIVPLSKARFTLWRTSDSSIARDTVLDLLPDADSVSLDLTVPLFTAGETFWLEIALVSTSGDTVFHGGPVEVSPTTSGQAPIVPIDVVFVGPGAGAASVQVTAPATPAACAIQGQPDPPFCFLTGDSVLLTAMAMDSGGTPIPNAIFGWSSLDSARARVATIDAQYRAKVVGGTQRGDARIVATTPTGLADTILLAVQPLPSTIIAESGSGQSSIVDSTLPQPLVARATAGDGLGVSGLLLRFTTSGGGSLTVDSALTDSTGRASTTWTLGPTSGTQTVTATVQRLTGSSATFNATALPGAPADIVASAGQGQTTVAGTAVAIPPAVLVTDANGNPVAGLTAIFEVAGGGSITGANPTTDASGIATVGSWTLGTTPGSNVLRAFMNLVPAPAGAEGAAAITDTILFTATGVVGPPAALTVIQGDAQTGTVGQALTDSLIVEASDGNANPAPGAQVAFAVTQGNGTVSADTVTTDGAGLAAVEWVVGTLAGTAHQVTVSIVGTAVSVNFSATAMPDSPDSLSFVVQPSNTTAGDVITPAVDVEILDQFANRVTTDNTTGVDIAITSGTGDPSAVLSGTLTQTAVAGLVTFGDLSIDSAGVGYTLDASIPSLAQATSDPFDVLAPSGQAFWIAAAGGNWSNPANWQSGIVPAATDTAFITLGGTYTVAVDAQVTVARLLMGGTGGAQTLSVGSNGLTVTGAADLGANATVSHVSPAAITIGGTLAIAGSWQTTGATVDVGGATVFASSANVTLDDATFPGTGSVTNSGGLTINPGPTALGGTFANLTGGTVTLIGNNGGANFTVTSGFTTAGTVAITGGFGSSLAVTSGTLTNTGTLTSSGSAGHTLAAALDNQGTLDIQGSGTLAVNAASAAHTNTGVVQLTGGNLTVTQSGTSPSFTHGGGQLVIASGQTLTIAGGAFGYQGGSLEGRGTLALTGNVAATVTPAYQNDTLTVSMTDAAVSGTGVLTNTGTWTLQRTTVSNAFTNSAALTVDPGATGLNGAFANTGSGTITLVGNNGGANFTVASGFTTAGTMTITGGFGSSLAVTSGTLTNTGTLTSSGSAGHTLAAALDNQGTLDIQGSGTLAVNAASAAHTNTGVVQLTGGNLTVTQSGTSPSFTHGGGQLVIASGQTLTIAGGAFGYQGGSLEGRGTLALTGNVAATVTPAYQNDTLTVSMTDAAVSGTGVLTNTGTWTLQRTTVSNAFTNSAALTVDPGATGLNGAFANTGSGTITLVGNNGGANFTVTSGFTTAGTVAITGGFGSSLAVTSGTLTNTGTLTSSGSAGHTLAAALDNQGTLDIQGSGTLAVNAASAAHTNTGVVQLTGGNLTVTQSGTSPSFTHAGGTVDVAAGRTLAVAGGSFAFTGGTIQGQGTADLTGTTISGLDGTFAPGTSPGVLTLDLPAGVTLGASAIVNVELGADPGANPPGVDNDFLRATSQLLGLGGTLNATLIGPYVPSGGESWPILAGVSGSFATVNLPPGVSDTVTINDTLYLGAPLLPPGTEAVWQGDTDTDWNNPANWDTGVVPDDTTSVFVPAGTPNTATVTGFGQVDDLVVEDGATLEITVDATLEAFGDVAAGNTISGAGTLEMSGVGTLSGSISELYISASGSVTLAGQVDASGSVVVEGALFLGGNRLNIAADFVTFNAVGQLFMFDPADTLDIGGDAFFEGGDMEDIVTDGVILLAGDLTQDNGGDVGPPDQFQPDAKVVLDGTGPQALSFSSASQSGSNIRVLEVTGTGPITGSDVWVVDQLIDLGGAWQVGTVFPGPFLSVVGTTGGGSYQFQNVSLTSGGFTLTGAVSVSGQLDLAGQSMTIDGDFATTGPTTGALVSQDPASSLTVTGNATFGGTNTTPFLTDGVLEIQGDLTQAAPVLASFDPSGNHLLRLSGTGVQTLSFFAPTSSTPQNIEITNTAGVTFATNVVANGQLIVPAAAAVNMHGDGNSLTVGGFDVDGMTLDSVLLVWNDGPTTLFDNVTFDSYPTTVTQLTVSHPGAVAAFPFNNTVFNTVPTSGLYISATDNALDANTLTIELSGSTPADGSEFTAELGGAVVNWLGAAAEWTGAVSTDWFATGNWSTGVIPNSATDDVLIPASAPLMPTLTASATVRDLTVESGASVDVSTFALTVWGTTVDATGPITGTGFVVVNSATANLSGQFPNLSVQGAVTAAGTVSTIDTLEITGAGAQFILNNQQVTVGGLFRFPSGEMVMTQPGDFLEIGGDVAWDASQAEANLSAGLIWPLGAQFNVGGSGLQIASGGTRIDFRGTAPQTVSFTNPGPAPAQHFGNVLFVNPAGVTLSTNAYAAGFATVQDGTLDLGTNTFTVVGPFGTSNTGALTMLDPAATVNASGNVAFGGASTAGLLTAGTINVAGNFQRTSGDLQAFRATGTHTVTFTGTGNHFVTIIGGGPPSAADVSHFARIAVAGIGTVFMNTDLYAAGDFISPTGTTATINGGGRKLAVGGLNVDDLVLDRVLLEWNGMTGTFGSSGTFTRFDNVTFTNYLLDQEQFRVVHPGAVSAFTVDGLRFNTTPTTGSYIFAADSVADANTLTVTLTNSIPGDGSALTTTVGGAVVNWPDAPPAPGINSWLGGSGVWSDDAQWSLGRAPVPGDTVEITTGNDYTVTLDVPATIARLTIGGTTDVITLDATPPLTITDPGLPAALEILPLGNLELTGTGGLTVEGISNQGTVRVTAPTTLTTTAVTNTGDWRVVNTALTVTSGSSYDFQTSGLLRVEDGGFLGFDGTGLLTLLGGTLEGGGNTQGNVIDLVNGAELGLQTDLTYDSLIISLNDARIQGLLTTERLTIGADAQLALAGGTLAEVQAPVVNQGTITVSEGTSNSLNDSLYNEGLLVFNAPTAVPTSLWANGVDNTGTVALSGDQATFRITGPGGLTNRSGATISTGPNGPYVIDGVLLNEVGGSVDVFGPLTLQRTASAAQNVNGGTINVTGGNLTVLQAGTSPSFTNDGTITVLTPRSLLVSNATNGTFTNAATGIINGTGTVNVTGGSPTVTNLGTIAPGLSPGLLTWQGNVAFGATSAIDIELGGTTVGTEYDRLGASGYQLALDGDLNVTLIEPIVPAVGDSFAIMTGVRSGQFAAVNLPTFPGVVLDTGSTLTTYYVIGRAPPPPGTEAIWQGDVDGDWNTLGNWDAGVVPDAATNVYIPAGTPNDPIISGGSSATDSLILEAGATLDVGADALLQVAGDLDAGYTSITGDGVVRMTGVGMTVQGSIGFLEITGDVTLLDSVLVSGNVDVTGAGASLDLGGNRLAVTGDFNTLSDGTLTMQDPADSLIVGGSAQFAGGGTSTLLSNGTLVVAQDFIQMSTTSSTSFAASGAHRTVLNGVGLQNIEFEDASTGLSRFQDLVIDNTASILAATHAHVEGAMTVNTAIPITGIDSLRVFGAGGITTVAGGSFTFPVVQLRGPLAIGGGYAVDTTVFSGAAQTVPALPYSHLFVENAGISAHATAGAALGIGGDLVIRGTGADFTVNGQVIDIQGDLMVGPPVTGASGQLIMTNASDSVVVRGDATFQGDPTGATMTAGALDIKGDFAQVTRGAVDDNFAPTGTHTTIFSDSTDAAPAQTISFAAPTTSFFNNVRVHNASGSGVSLSTNAFVSGTLTADAGAPIVGTTLTVIGDATFDGDVTLTGLNVASVLSASNAYTVATTNFNGAGQTIPAGLDYQDIIVGGTASLEGLTETTAAVTIFAGNLTIGPNTLNVGNLQTAGSGTLTMNNDLGLLDVTGDVTFAGGSTAGLLTGGTLRIGGNFDQVNTTSNSSFFASGGFRTEFDGAAAQLIDFATPDSLTGSHFANLAVHTADAGATLNSDVYVIGDFRVTDSLSTSIATVVSGAGDLIVSGDVTVAQIGSSNAVLQPSAVRLGGTLSSSGVFTPPLVQFFGTAQDIPVNNGVVLQYTDVLVSRSAQFTGNTTIGSDLTVSGAAPNANLNLNTHFVTVTDNFSTSGGGALTMQSTEDTLFVQGNASFGGAGTNTLLTAGLLAVQGNFTQTSPSTAAFSASGTHRVQLFGSGAQTLTFATPGTIGASSHFNELQFNKVGGSVDLASDVITNAQLISIGPTTTVTGGGTNALTVAGVDIDGMVLDNVIFTVDGGTFDGFDGVTFQNYASSANQLNFSHPGIDATTFEFFSLTFVPLTGGDLGSYITATDSDAASPFLDIDIIGSNVTANGATFTKAVDGAGVTWLP